MTPERIASADDVARLVEMMPVDCRVAALLGAMGLRQAEVFGLTVGAVDFRLRIYDPAVPAAGLEGLTLPGVVRWRAYATDPRGTTHWTAWPVTEAMRSKSAS